MLRMAFCICLGFLMGAYLAKGFSQQNEVLIRPIVESTKTIEQSFFNTSVHLLRLKYDKVYRESYEFEESSAVIAYIGESNLQKDTVLSNLALTLGEKAIEGFYGDTLTNAAKSNAAVVEQIQVFKDLCIEKGGHLLDNWDSSQPMANMEEEFLFKPVFWYKGTSIGSDSGVVCLKS